MEEQNNIFLSEISRIKSNGVFKIFGSRWMSVNAFLFKKKSNSFGEIVLETQVKKLYTSEYFKIIINDDNFLKELFKSILINDGISKEELKDYLHNVIENI